MKTLRKVRAFVGRHYVLKRLLQMIPILFGITLLTFLIMKIAPGSPLQTMINPKLSMEDIQAAEDALGLNDPIYVQYFKWLGQILQGNLGYSVMSGRSVTDIITERIGPTLLLTLTSYAISLLFGLIFGIYSATHSGSVGDYILTVLAFIGVAVSSFFLALGSVYVFSLKLGWVPTGAMRTIGVELTGWSGFVDVVRHMTLPAIVMALPQTASITRYARSSMLDVIHEDFIRTARAKGLGEKRVIFVHALRNALIPIITLFGLSLPGLLGGSYIVESIFNWPGLGTLGIKAITAREYSELMALNLITAVLVLLGNFIADMLYTVADPRIRVSKGKGE